MGVTSLIEINDLFSQKLNPVRSLHGTPKPLAASSSTNLLNRQHELEPLRLNSDSSLDGDSSLEECEGDNFVVKEQGYFAQFEEEQKLNVEVWYAFRWSGVCCAVLCV